MEKINSGLSAVWGRIRQDIGNYRLGLLAAAGLYFLFHYLFGAFCPSLLLTGFPCPGCGMTRAVLCLLRGEFQRSFLLNPSAGLWTYWVFCFLFERYVRGRSPKWLMWTAFAIAAWMILSYLYRMAVLFPNRPPYVYRRNNLLAKWLPGYEEAVKQIFDL